MCTLDIILFELRKQKKTQAALAEYLGMTKNAVSEWKSGRNSAYKKYLPEIAQFLGVSMSYLANEETQNNEITDNDIKRVLFNGSEEITDEMYEEVKQYAEMVKLREEKKREDRIKQNAKP